MMANIGSESMRDYLIIAGESPPADHIALAPMEPVLRLANE